MIARVVSGSPLLRAGEIAERQTRLSYTRRERMFTVLGVTLLGCYLGRGGFMTKLTWLAMLTVGACAFAGCATTQYGNRAKYAGTRCEDGKRALYAGMKCKPPASPAVDPVPESDEDDSGPTASLL